MKPSSNVIILSDCPHAEKRGDYWWCKKYNYRHSVLDCYYCEYVPEAVKTKIEAKRSRIKHGLDLFFHSKET
jgi:hypothetical protein